MTGVDDVELDPDFLSSMIFHTPSRYSILGGADKCGLYDLILSNLAQGANGDIQKFVVRYKNKEGETKLSLLDRNRFFKDIAFKQCPKVEKFQQYFSLRNLPKTLKTINLTPPVSMASCENSHKEFIKDPKAPYLCYISEKVSSIARLEDLKRTTPRSQYRKLQKIKRDHEVAKRYSSLLSSEGADYLNNLCQNIDSSKAFCDGFFNNNFWHRVSSGEKSKHFMKDMCQDIYKKENLTQKNYKDCANKLTKDPSLCLFSGARKGDLTPRQNCSLIGSALNYSRLKADYEDCPAKVGNPAVVNLARIITHFSAQTPPDSPYCHASISSVYAQFAIETSESRHWKNALCFEDKILNEEVCHPVINGDIEGNNLSLSKVVEKILKRTKGLGIDQSCKVANKKDYRPELLKYKSGCFVIIDFDNCNGVSCEYDILMNQRKIDFIRKRTGAIFDYFPNNYAGENFAQSKLIAKKYKLKDKKITNITALKIALNESANAIVHGVACAEGVLPANFKKTNLNQCTPLPFIVDGYKKEKGSHSVIFRSGIDSIHAPRIIPWPHLFSALKDYQRHHPLNQWGLHALY